MSNQLFEAVPVSEKPEKDDWYPCLLNNEARSSAHILFARGKWNTHYNITHWLRPIPTPTKEAKVLEDIYTEWTKSTNRNGGVLIGSSIHEFIKFASEKLSAKGHQEASTGQAGTTVEDDWVRVGDGLPENGSIVLIAWPNGEIEIHSVGLKEQFKKMPIAGWRYLPSPPKS